MADPSILAELVISIEPQQVEYRTVEEAVDPCGISDIDLDLVDWQITTYVSGSREPRFLRQVPYPFAQPFTAHEDRDGVATELFDGPAELLEILRSPFGEAFRLPAEML